MRPYLYLFTFLFSLATSAQNFEEVRKITSAYMNVKANFGSSMHVDGNTLVIGAPKDNNVAAGYTNIEAAGSVAVFDIINGSFIQTQHLVNPDRQKNGNFGDCVLLIDDLLFIGAPTEDKNPGPSGVNFSGHVHVFKKNNGLYTYHYKLEAPDVKRDGQFGASLAYNGKFLFIGSPGESRDTDGENEMFRAGAVYVFELDNGTAVFHSKLVTSDRWTFDFFGKNIDVENNILVVSAHGDDEDPKGGNPIAESGSVYVFKYNATKDEWIESQKINAFDRLFHSFFGTSLSLSNNVLAVGAPGNYYDKYGIDSMIDAGAVYVYRNVAGRFEFKEKLDAFERFEYSRFGTQVKLENQTLLVGNDPLLYKLDATDTFQLSGEVYAYREQTNKTWKMTQLLKNKDSLPYDAFGAALLIRNDTVYIGAKTHNYDEQMQNFKYQGGAVFVYVEQQLSSIVKQKTLELSVYPNPTSKLIQIKGLPNEEIEYEIIDSKGSLCSIGEIQSEHIISISNLNTGIYFLKVKTSQGEFRARFVKI